MKAGWQVNKLGEICSFLNRGISPKYLEDGGICVLNQKCIRDHEVNFALARRHDISAKRVSSERLVQTGDVLINSTGTGTLGRVAQLRTVPPEPTTVDSHVTVARPLPGKFFIDFFGYMLIFIEELIKKAGEGCGGQTELARSVLSEKFSVAYPSSQTEQRRIVAILNQAFDGIAVAKANAEKNLHSARALFESQLQSIFTERDGGWIEAPLSDLCDIKHGYAFEGEFFSTQGDYVLLTPGNFYETGGYRDRGEKQKYYVGGIPREYVLNEGDLLVAMTEQAAGLLGSPILVPESDKFLHNQRLGLVTKKSGVTWANEFFFHVFNTQAVRQDIHKSASGVKVRHTSPTKIGQVVVAFPRSTIEQSRIVAMLGLLAEETQRLEALYRKKLSALDDLKKSLLHRAFSGQL